jgi:hypothetical protein
MTPTVSIERWNELKKVRKVADKLYLHTEVFEKKLAGRGVFINDDVSSEIALKEMNEAIKNGTFKFITFSF